MYYFSETMEGFLGTPWEIILLIVSFMRPVDVVRFSLTCKQLLNSIEWTPEMLHHFHISMAIERDGLAGTLKTGAFPLEDLVYVLCTYYPEVVEKEQTSIGGTADDIFPRPPLQTTCMIKAEESLFGHLVKFECLEGCILLLKFNNGDMCKALNTSYPVDFLKSKFDPLYHQLQKFKLCSWLVRQYNLEESEIENLIWRPGGMYTVGCVKYPSTVAEFMALSE